MSKPKKYLSGTFQVHKESGSYYVSIDMASGWQLPDCPRNFTTADEADQWAKRVIRIRHRYEEDMIFEDATP